MKDNKKMKFSSDDILKETAKLIEEEFKTEMEGYEDAAVRLTDEQAPIDEQFLEFARQYDKEQAQKKKKSRVRRLGRIAAIFLIVTIAMGGITMGVSEAFRLKVFELIFDGEEGGMFLKPEQPKEEELLESLSEGYWYPEYLPEDCELVFVEETETRKAMAFEPEDKSYYITLFEYFADGVSLSFDTEFLVREKVVIGESEGYLFTDEEYNSCVLVWHAEDKVLEVTTYDFSDREEILKIAKNIKYQE